LSPGCPASCNDSRINPRQGQCGLWRRGTSFDDRTYAIHLQPVARARAAAHKPRPLACRSDYRTRSTRSWSSHAGPRRRTGSRTGTRLRSRPGPRCWRRPGRSPRSLPPATVWPADPYDLLNRRNAWARSAGGERHRDCTTGQDAADNCRYNGSSHCHGGQPPSGSFAGTQPNSQVVTKLKQTTKLLLVGLWGWWSQGESNPRPLECHSSALPTELWPRRKSDVSGQ
jgi:hypothetical protein